MFRFRVVIECVGSTEVLEVEAPDAQAAIAASLVELRANKPTAAVEVVSVLDPDDETGNSMPLAEWSAG